MLMQERSAELARREHALSEKAKVGPGKLGDV
jgi:hypothetical protein